MAESHVVSALVNKRAEIAGLISRTERQLGQFRADLVHLDAKLRLFAPELEPKAIPAKRIRQPDRWFEQGELSRRVLDAVRRAGGPNPRAGPRPGRDDQQRPRPGLPQSLLRSCLCRQHTRAQK